MNDYLLLISLGPIQDFIASARRCQDLWYGSWLLSALARAAARAMEDKAGVDALIFPASLQQIESPSVANKILLRVPFDQVKEIAELGLTAMNASLKEYRDEAFGFVEGPFFQRELAEQQVDELMEFMWVAVPIDAEGYPVARKRAEAALAARKNTRSWGAVPWHALAGAGVPKSSLDGLRESVIHEDAYETLEPEALRKAYFVRKAERLCGVGLMKRVGVDPDVPFKAQRPTFHSTAHIAAYPLLTRVDRLDQEEVIEAYVDALKDLGLQTKKLSIRVGEQGNATALDMLSDAQVTHPRTFNQRFDDRRGLDGALFFEGRLADIFEQYAPEGADVAAAQRALNRCLQQLKAQPCPYYAMLLADGDRMGKAHGCQLKKLERNLLIYLQI